MCGIAGFIGLSKKPKATYEIMTNLFDFLESRGTDASGLWASEAGPTGRILYHKEPIKSSDFVKKDFWKKTRKLKLNLFLAHARATSKGNGHASVNSNNHPFTSLDRRIGMVHNGTIDEADILMKKYQCFSETDSEVILRIFENGTQGKVELPNVSDQVACRLAGIRDIWASITEGAMAVALGERESDTRRNLFLFRNDQRPLWLADLRTGLGQMFFFSSPDIWYRAMGNVTEGVKAVVKDQKLIEIPPSEVWMFYVDDDNPQISTQSQFCRFALDVKKTGRFWHEDEDFVVIQPPKESLTVVTELTHDDEIQPEEKALIVHPQKHFKVRKKPTCNWDDNGEMQYARGGTEHETICDAIATLVRDISTTATNACLEGTISPTEYQEIIESLQNTRTDLQGTLKLIGG